MNITQPGATDLAHNKGVGDEVGERGVHTALQELPTLAVTSTHSSKITSEGPGNGDGLANIVQEVTADHLPRTQAKNEPFPNPGACIGGEDAAMAGCARIILKNDAIEPIGWHATFHAACVVDGRYMRCYLPTSKTPEITSPDGFAAGKALWIIGCTLDTTDVITGAETGVGKSTPPQSFKTLVKLEYRVKPAGFTCVDYWWKRFIDLDGPPIVAMTMATDTVYINGTITDRDFGFVPNPINQRPQDEREGSLGARIMMCLDLAKQGKGIQTNPNDQTPPLGEENDVAAIGVARRNNFVQTCDESTQGTYDYRGGPHRRFDYSATRLYDVKHGCFLAYVGDERSEICNQEGQDCTRSVVGKYPKRYDNIKHTTASQISGTLPSTSSSNLLNTVVLNTAAAA
jgi:hypothetical protein